MPANKKKNLLVYGKKKERLRPARSFLFFVLKKTPTTKLVLADTIGGT